MEDKRNEEISTTEIFEELNEEELEEEINE